MFRPFPIPAVPGRYMIVAMHLFSGIHRAQDICYRLVVLSWSQGWEVHVEDVDLDIAHRHDLPQDEFYRGLLDRCLSGVIAWLFGGPPCGSWSPLRFRPHGPPPVRDRDHLTGLPGLSTSMQKVAEVGNKLV